MFLLRFGLFAPVGGKRGEWAERARLCSLTRETREKSRDDLVLLGERQFAERGSGVAAFEEHRIECGVGFQELNGGMAGPDAEAVDFVSRFEVRHADFEDGGGTVRALCGRDE